MRRFLKLSMMSLLMVFSALVVTETASAQRPEWANRRYTRTSVDQVIKRVEQRTDTFVSQLDRSLDDSRLDGTRREDNLNQRAKDLEAATDELRSEFNRRGDSWWETRSNVERCLSLAADIDVAVRNRRFKRGAENNWKNVRSELNSLARVYGLPPMRAYK